MEEIKEKETQKVLDELKEVRPEKLTGEAKRLFEAIMKIADERDELLKERQADKEKIKELIKKINIDIERNNRRKEQIEKEPDGVYINHLVAYEPETVKRILQELLKDRGE